MDFFTASITNCVFLLIPGHLLSGRNLDFLMPSTSLASSWTIKASWGSWEVTQTSSGFTLHPIWRSRNLEPNVKSKEAECSWYGIMKSLTCKDPLEAQMAKSMVEWERKEQWIVATVVSGWSQWREAVHDKMTPAKFLVTSGRAVTVVGNW